MPNASRGDPCNHRDESRDTNHEKNKMDPENASTTEEKLSLLESKVQNIEAMLLLYSDPHAVDIEQQQRTRNKSVSLRGVLETKCLERTRAANVSSLSMSTGRSTSSRIYRMNGTNINSCADKTDCNTDGSTDVLYSDDDDEMGAMHKPSAFKSTKDSKTSLNSSIIEDDLNEEDDYKHLSQDTFSLMLLSNAFSKQWLFGLGVFLLQIGLLSMIVMDQFSSSKDSSPFDVPYRVDTIVHIGQLLAIFLSLTTQTDLVVAVMTFMLLWTERRSYWTKLIKVPENASLWVWTSRIAFPICCEFIEGSCVLFTTFVIVIQSSNVIDLFKDFAAMQIISELDNMMFWLALHGYVGNDLAKGAKQAIKIKIHDNITKAYWGVPLRTLILLGICLAMIGSWGYFAYGQVSGKFFALKYPKCHISDKEILKLNDGICDGGQLNTIACGFDDGDCITFNLAYPNCKIDEPTKIGDGICDQEYNDEDCLYDGDDCCPFKANDFVRKDLYGDGHCHGGALNTGQCDYDGGDCIMANVKYPNCSVLSLTHNVFPSFDMTQPIPALGDGRCDGGIFNTKECGWDDGDCLVCNTVVPDSSKIGDGRCDGGLYLEFLACNYDGQDCSAFVKNFPDCSVPEPERIGNGHCDGNIYFTSSCGMDGGDCALCNVTYTAWVGDGICDGNQYLTDECSLDGGDCDSCLASGADPKSIGDGICHPELNTTECGWDGHDCMDNPKLEPCIVEHEEWLGDGHCDGGLYNTAACAYDSGDCLECNAIVLGNQTKIGNGICDGAAYNIIECGWDGNDCDSKDSADTDDSFDDL